MNTIKNDNKNAIRALTLSVLMIGAVMASSIAFTGTVGAAVNADTLTVTSDSTPVKADGTITVEGNLDSTGDVTFLVQDPSDTDVDTVTKSISSTDFSVDIDLSSMSFGDGLDDGTATISADKASGFKSADASTTFEVDTEHPSASIDSPSDGADLTSHPTLSGTASDDNSIDSVEVRIQRASDDNYYTGSSWQTSETWVPASGTTDWSYDTNGNGISSDDSYNVTVRVTDDAGHTRSWTAGPPVPTSNTMQVDYTVDTTKPSINSVTVTEKDGDDTVQVGDTVNVSADVTDAQSGVDTVTVDASALGGSQSLTLSHNVGDTYYDSFTVSSPTVSDGSVSLTVNATDAFGLSETDSDSITLETSIDSIDSLSVHQDFVGIVEDTNKSVRVTASGVQDAQGHTIGSETATLEIAGTTYSVSVSSGTIDTTIDTTKIANDETTGSTTVSVSEASAGSATDTVRLVHEVRGLDQGYQIQGTPMDATNVVFDGVSDVTTYDPTATNTKWISASEQQAGEGYYVNGKSDAARMGFVFEQTGQLRSTQLHEGYNLVGATPDLNTNDKVRITDDLGDGVNVSNANVDVYTRDTSTDLTDPSGDASVSAFNEGSGTTDVSGFEGYFVYVDSGTDVRIVDKNGYDPSQGS
jgi:hypothetical protein